MNSAGFRFAEVLGALSLASDVANGFTYEKTLRTSLIALDVARAHGISGAILGDIYYATLVRFVGCTGFAHEESRWYAAGDDIGLQSTLLEASASWARCSSVATWARPRPRCADGKDFLQHKLVDYGSPLAKALFLVRAR